MSELRWHPLLSQWVITATTRQERTFLPPKDYCPLCPQAPGGEIAAATYDMVVFENRFPSLQRHPPVPAVAPTPLSPVEPAQGTCEVIVYTPRHDLTFAGLEVRQIEKLIMVWQDRYRALGARPDIAYVYFFENKGEAIGVTLNHPHGQIYALPFIPPYPRAGVALQCRAFCHDGPLFIVRCARRRGARWAPHGRRKRPLCRLHSFLCALAL